MSPFATCVICSLSHCPDPVFERHQNLTSRTFSKGYLDLILRSRCVPKRFLRGDLQNNMKLDRPFHTLQTNMQVCQVRIASRTQFIQIQPKNIKNRLFQSPSYIFCRP